MRNIILVVFFFFAAALSGCVEKMITSVIPQKAYKAEQVSKIKKVAIVAFEVGQFVPTGLAGKALGGVTTAQMVSNTDAIEHELANQVYGILDQKLKTRKSFQVLALKEVVKNPTYAQIQNAQTNKTQALLKSQANMRSLSIKGLMRAVNNGDYIFSPEEIKKLCQVLKVDALVIAELDYRTHQNDPMGLGLSPIYLMSYFKFWMFNANAEKIWFDLGYEGPASDESLGRVNGMEDSSVIDKLSQPLAEQTLDAFFKVN